MDEGGTGGWGGERGAALLGARRWVGYVRGGRPLQLRASRPGGRRQKQPAGRGPGGRGGVGQRRAGAGGLDEAPPPNQAPRGVGAPRGASDHASGRFHGVLGGARRTRAAGGPARASRRARGAQPPFSAAAPAGAGRAGSGPGLKAPTPGVVRAGAGRARRGAHSGGRPRARAANGAPPAPPNRRCAALARTAPHRGLLGAPWWFGPGGARRVLLSGRLSAHTHYHSTATLRWGRSVCCLLTRWGKGGQRGAAAGEGGRRAASHPGAGPERRRVVPPARAPRPAPWDLAPAPAIGARARRGRPSRPG
jgi:hypothetical protein